MSFLSCMTFFLTALKNKMKGFDVNAALFNYRRWKRATWTFLKTITFVFSSTDKNKFKKFCMNPK